MLAASLKIGMTTEMSGGGAWVLGLDATSGGGVTSDTWEANS